MVDLAAQRPSPAASGTFAKTPLLHLLIYALEKKLAGTIDIVSPDHRVASVLFVAGEPAKAHLSEPVSQLGQVLVDLGFVSADVLDRTLADLEHARVAGSRALCGEFLRMRALVGPACVNAAFREQIARRLRYVSMMPPEATYSFYDGFDALAGIGVVSPQGVDPLPMLWTLLCERAPQAHVEAALARVAGSFAPDREDRGPRSPRSERPGAGRDRAAARPPADGGGVLAAQRPRRARGAASDVPAARDKAGRPDLFVALVGTATAPNAPQQPFAGASSGPASAAGAPASSGPASAAGTAASSNPAIAGASASSGPASAGAPSSRPVTPTSLVPLGDVTPSRPPPRLAPELFERWTAVVERARTINRADYFAMLNLARDSTPEEAESGFLALVMKWHPDRLPPELLPLREACSRVFARLSEARATLTDPKRRAGYMRLLAEGSGSPEMQETIIRVVAATEDFKKAEVYFKRNDFVQAEELCRRALAGDATQADYLAMLAWLISLKPESQPVEKTVTSIRMLDKAIAMSDQCERAFFWRGMLYKRIGRDRGRVPGLSGGGRAEPRQHRRRPRDASLQHAIRHAESTAAPTRAGPIQPAAGPVVQAR